MRAWIVFLLVPACVWLALCIVLYFGQRSQMYFPVPESDPPGATAIRMDGDGVQLKVWTVGRPGPRALIYFGGNAEDVSANLASFASAFPDHTLYLVNYRGYGGSTGRPTEAGLFADATAIFDRIREAHPDVSVVGRSLGSGVAAWLASRRPVRRLVLVTPFDSLVNVASSHFRVFPVRLMMRDRFDSAGRVGSIRAPTLVVVAGSDEIIPRARSDALVAAFPAAQVESIVVPHATHNDPMPQYLVRAREFLEE